MATLATLIAAVRLELDDEPAKIQLNGAISSTTAETVVVNSGETDKLQAGMRLEHDDATGESRRVLSVTSTTNFEAERGYLGSTAATHSDNTYMLIAPRWRYDQVSRAITTALVTMFSKGIYPPPRWRRSWLSTRCPPGSWSRTGSGTSPSTRS
jgi:hypothetical protein